VGFILCFLAGGALVWGYDAHRLKNGDMAADNNGGGAAGTWSDDDSPVPIDSKDPSWGSRTAPVTIVEFSDFQCPYCGRAEPALAQIKQTYGPEKVRLVWKNEPLSFHQNAKPSAEAGEGVFELKGNDAFWKFHDAAFKDQQQLSQDNYEKWAQQAGVSDLGKFKAGLAAHKWADKVEKDHAVAQKVGIVGTPGFMINGVLVSGAQPFDAFKAVIDQELSKAQAKVAAGTPKGKVYVVLSQENKKAPPPRADDDGEKEDKSIWKVPVGKSPILGSDKALVTIVEFSDFQCPYCKRGEDTLKQIKETYGDKVRFVWKHEPLPFHKNAEPAAEFAMEARAEKGDKGFWDAHDKLFALSPKLEDADLEGAAKDLGLAVDKVKSAIKDHKYKKDIDTDQDLAEAVHASSTPHFFINGRRIVGSRPFEMFKSVIDDEITKANGLLGKGTKPNEIYDALVKDGKVAAK